MCILALYLVYILNWYGVVWLEAVLQLQQSNRLLYYTVCVRTGLQYYSSMFRLLRSARMRARTTVRTVQYSTVQYSNIQYCTVYYREQNGPCPVQIQTFLTITYCIVQCTVQRTSGLSLWRWELSTEINDVFW